MKFTSKALIVALGALAAAQVQAAQAGGDGNSFYFGASYIRAMYNVSTTDQDKNATGNLSPQPASFTASYATDDNGYEVHAGYMFAPNFGIEVGYADFGKFVQTLKIVGTTGATPTTQSYSFATTAFTASLIGSYQLEGGLSIFGRLSGMYTTTKASLDGTGFIQSTAYTKSEYNKFVPGAGIGAAFNVNDQFRIRAEFDYWYQPTDNTLIAVKDLKNIVVGADVSFY